MADDFELIEETYLDDNTVLKISKNIMSGRVFVEFSSTKPRVVLQKNFQDTILGNRDANDFSNSITNTSELLQYFGIKNKENE